VTGKSSYANSGAKSYVNISLLDFEVVRFYEFSSNPSLPDVLNGIEKFNNFQPDCIVAIGGGSVIDMAKLIKALAGSEDPMSAILNKEKIEVADIPLIAIPTTSGTGSETTHFATIYVGGQKYSVADDSLLPNGAIVDPELTQSMTSSITANTGMDALTQAIESWWAVAATDASKKDALKAIELIWSNIETAVLKPDIEVRKKMAHGAYYAGRAINVSKTTVCHALSYHLTAKFDITHGQAVSVFLPMFIRHMGDSINDLLPLFDVSSADQLANLIEEKMSRIGLKISLTELGLSANDLPDLISSVNADRLSNYPLKVDLAELIGGN